MIHKNLFSTRASVLLTALTLGASFVSAGAEDYARATDASAAGNWTDSSKWTPEGVPQMANDTAIFNIGATQQTVTLDTDVLIGSLGVGYHTGAESLTGNLRLEAGAGDSLSIGNISTAGTLFVGAGTSSTTGSATGTLSIGSGVKVTLSGEGSAFYVGGHNAGTTNLADPVSGTVTLETGASLRLGSSGARAQWVIGRQNSANATTTSGSVSGSGGSLEAWISTLVVGQNTRGNGNAEVHNASGTLDLSGLASASIDTHSLIVGRSSQTSAHGSIILGNDQTLAVSAVTSGMLQIGVRDSGNANANALTGVADGTVTLKAGSEMSVGSAVSRAEATLGQNNGSRGGTMIAEGSIVAESGSGFSGYFSSLTLGRQQRVDTGIVYRATGIMDLREAAIDAFDVSGDLMIGNGTGEGSQGELRLSTVAGTIGGNLTVGDTKTGGGAQEASSGLLQLNGARLAIEGNVSLLQTGQVLVSVSGQSAGLLLGENATLSISQTGSALGDPLAGYHISFDAPAQNPEGLYYGLAWEGNHLDTLGVMVDNFAITWSGNDEYGLYYDAGQNLTYIGVPEPSAVALILVAGGIWAFLRRRRA